MAQDSYLGVALHTSCMSLLDRLANGLPIANPKMG
jgi:hypothetical protein